MTVGSMTVTLIAWVVVLIFPAWAAHRLFRRGQSKHAWATLLTIPVGLGWLVGIYALTRPTGEPVLLDEPCPSCQGDRALQAAVTLDAGTGERTPLLVGALAALLIGLAIIGGGVAMGIITWSGGDDGIIQWRYGSKVAGASFMLLGFGFGVPVIRYGAAYFAADRVIGTLNRCVGCGNVWTALPGAPAEDDTASVPSTPATSAAECSDGPEGCWGPVFAEEGGEPLCRGHLALRERTVASAHPGEAGVS